jgi:hypothetical protein
MPGFGPSGFGRGFGPAMGGAFGGRSLFGSEWMRTRVEDDPEMRKLHEEDEQMMAKTNELAQQYRRARSDSEKEKIRSQLNELVNSHYDIRQKRRELEVRKLEEQIQNLREAVRSRSKNRESIIDVRISQLTGEQAAQDF